MKTEKGSRLTPRFAAWQFVFGGGRIPQITLALVASVFALPAATSKPATAKSPAANSALLSPPPQSVFVIPKKATEGKDPFFPSATRIYNLNVEVKPKGPAPVEVELSLKGISGTAVEPLAIINTTTFTTGEENDVLTGGGRMRVRCVEINMAAGTALVQVGGQRRELRLQTKK